MYGDKFLGRKAENMSTLAPGKKDRVGPAYGDATRTGLKKSVTGGQKNVIDLEIQ